MCNSDLIREEPDEDLCGLADEMCNFDRTTTCSQRKSQVKFVDDINDTQSECDDIDDLIDQILNDLKPVVEINEIM